MNFNPDISGLPGYEDFHRSRERLNEQLSELVKQHSLARDKWSEQMMKDFIVQLIMSGDVFRLCTVDTDKESICYHPYEQVVRLKDHIAQLENVLHKIKELSLTASTVAEINKILYPCRPL